MANKHMPYDLAQMQSLPLRAKIIMTQQRIRQWYEYWDGQVYVSFSGGKDSTVLKHIVDGMYSDVPSLFVNTGLEYPELQSFVRDIKAGKYDCFNTDVEIVRPKISFKDVLIKYGYPVISKRVAGYIYTAKRNPDSQRARWIRGDDWTKFVAGGKYTYLIDSPFGISAHCCDVMKKAPAKKYAKETGRKPILGVMASESVNRANMWMKNGCNGFDMKEPVSNPMSFWTEQDVLHYIKKFNVPYCSVYGDIVIDEKTDGENVLEGQINLIDYLNCHEEGDRLKTTGCDRTGCIYCMFGCNHDGTPNRFQRLKQTHPRQYEYCIGGGEYVVDETTEAFGKSSIGKWRKADFVHEDNTPMTLEEIAKFVDDHKYDEDWKFINAKWQPSKEGLGLSKVLEYIGVDYE